MARHTQAADHGAMTQTAYAAHRKAKGLDGESQAAVHSAIKSGRLDKSLARDATGRPVGIADVDLADREWAANTDTTRKSVTSPDGEESDLKKAQAKKEHWKALEAELSFKREAREVIPGAEMARRIADIGARVRVRLLALPSNARQRLPHLTVADVTVLDEMVREALEALAEGGE